MHENNLRLFEKYALPHFSRNMRILEIGPEIIPSSFQQHADAQLIWETLELHPIPGLTHLAKHPHKFDLPDNSYDIVIAGQVAEHVRGIWTWMVELARICKKGGHVIMVTPISWPYHEAPEDCWRIYPKGMQSLYENAGLTVDLCKVETLDIDLSKVIVPNECNCFPGRHPLTRADILKRRLRGHRVGVPGASDTKRWAWLNPILGLPATFAVDMVTIGHK